MKTIIDALLEPLNIIIDSLGDIFETQHEHNAEFGNPNKLIKKRNKGFCVDGKKFLDIETSRRNFCVVAGSGKGKTQNHIFPTILNSTFSMLINDNSGELEKCVGYLESEGFNAKVLNLLKKGDVYINPLDAACKGDISAIRKISKTLMGYASDKNDFFSLSAEDCLTLFIEFVLESQPRIYANLGNVYRLILEFQGSPKVIEQLFMQKASDKVWAKFKALSGNSERTLKSITSTALSALSWLGDNETLASITSVTNISLKDFRKSPHALFIQYPASDTKFYAPMVSLIFQNFYQFAFSKLPNENDLDILMILDEFSSLISGLPEYSNIISNSRKFKIPQCIILQDESLLSPYKELKDNILSNCFVKCYYGGQEKKSFELEKLLGTYSYTDKKTGKKKERPLMYASEIREMDNEIIVLPNGQKPLKVKVTPAYKQAALNKKLNMEPSAEKEQVANYSIQYIDLTPYREAVKAAAKNTSQTQKPSKS